MNRRTFLKLAGMATFSLAARKHPHPSPSPSPSPSPTSSPLTPSGDTYSSYLEGY